MNFPCESGIYLIHNKVSGKSYVGQSVNLRSRLRTHIQMLRANCHYNTYLQRAWNKYGESSFELTVLELCETDMLDDREIYYISLLDSFSDGYNMTAGGGGALGRIASANARAKMRESRRKYTSKHRGANSPVAKGVVLINTGELFGSMSEASMQYHVSLPGISQCCARKSASAGRVNGEKLVWVYYTDFIRMTDEDIVDAIRYAQDIERGAKSGSAHGIVLLNTRESFPCIREASSKFGIDRNSIKDCCTGRQKFGGELDGEKLVWVYIEDYQRMRECDIQNSIDTANPPNKKVCLKNTGEVFWSVAHAGKVYGLDRNAIRHCCDGRTKSSGCVNGEKLVWAWNTN